MNPHEDRQDAQNVAGSETEDRRALPEGHNDDASSRANNTGGGAGHDNGNPGGPRGGGDRAGGPGDDGGNSGGPSADQPNVGQPPTAHRFFVWLRGLNIRRGENRWIGGVASGIAARIGIDPVIVRGLFVLFVIFGGIGILLYGLAWALLPEPDGRIHLEGAARGYWTDGMTGALIVTIFGFFRPFGGFWGGAWEFGDALWTLLWVGGLIALCVWLANSARERKRKRTTAYAPDAGQPGHGGGAGYPGGSGYDAPAGEAGPADYGSPGRPGSVDPAGHAWPTAPAASTAPAAQQPDYGPLYESAHEPSARAYGPVNDATYGPAGDYTRARAGGGAPAPYATHTKKVRSTPGAAMVAIATGLALLAGGGLLALHYTNVIDLGAHPHAIAAAAAAVVLGLSIVIAGLRGRSSGGMGFLAVVALIAAMVFSVVPTSNNFVIGANTTWNPSTLETAEAGYTTTMGRGTLQLEDLGDQAPLDEEVVIPVDVAMGSTTVVVPDDIPVEVRSNLLLGSINFDSAGPGSDGIWNPANQTFNAGAPGEKIIIEVRGTLSSATISESGNGF